MGIQLLSHLQWYKGEKESKAYARDNQDLCPPGYPTNVIHSLENISGTEQAAISPAAV